MSKHWCRKASIQLGVNFIVVMIISIILLGIGIKLISMFWVKSEEVKKNVDKYMQEKLEAMLNQGSLVAAYPNKVSVSRNKYAQLGVGIRNELGEDASFAILVERDETNSKICNQEPSLLYDRGSFVIRNNERAYRLIAINLPSGCDRGVHIFNIYVCKALSYESLGECYRDSSQRYGDLEKVFVYLN